MAEWRVLLDKVRAYLKKTPLKFRERQVRELFYSSLLSFRLLAEGVRVLP